MIDQTTRTCQVIYYGSQRCGKPAYFEVLAVSKWPDTKIPPEKFAVCNQHRHEYETADLGFNCTITEIEPHI